MATATAYRSVFKNAAYIFFIKLFPAIANVAVIIIFSRGLDEAGYGHYQDFWVKLLLLGTLAYAGLPVTLITYAPDVIKYLFRQINNRHLVVFACWLFLWLLVFAWLENNKLQLPFYLSGGMLLLYVVHSIQESLMIAAKKMSALLVFNFAFAVYFLIVHILAIDDYYLENLLILVTIGMIIRALSLSFIIYKTYKQILPASIQLLSISKTKNLWLHLGFYDLIQNVFRWIDKFILSIILTSELYAIYFNGSQDVPFLPYLLGAVGSAVLVQLAGKTGEQKDESYLLLRESGKLLSSLVFPLFFYLFFFSNELFSVVLSEKYLPAVPIFIMSILVVPLRAYNYTTLLQHFHKGALINKGAVMDLVIALLLMYPLYLLFGLPGIALGFVISTYIQVGYYLHHSSRLLNRTIGELLPIKNWTLKFTGFGILIFAIHYLLSISVQPKSAVIIGGGVVLAMSVLILKLELNKTRAAGATSQ